MDPISWKEIEIALQAVVDRMIAAKHDAENKPSPPPPWDGVVWLYCDQCGTPSRESIHKPWLESVDICIHWSPGVTGWRPFRATERP